MKEADVATETKVLKDARELIESRLREINEETRRLERAVASLNGERRGPGRPRKSKAKASVAATPKSGSDSRKRRRRSGTRSDQALDVVAKNPGITGSQIATKLKSDPNYVYRVMGELVAEGKVQKDRRRYLAVGS